MWRWPTMAHLRSQLTYANVMASVAVFVALGGTSVAAVSLKRNSVGSKQVKKGAIKEAHLLNGAVTSPKVRNGSLLLTDFKAGQIPAGARGAQGARGPQGLRGAAGAQGTAGTSGAPGDPGDPGAPGVSGLVQVFATPVPNPPGMQTSSTATCPAGKTVIAGGANTAGNHDMQVNASYPNGSSAWTVRVNNTASSGISPTFGAVAMCAVVQ